VTVILNVSVYQVVNILDKNFICFQLRLIHSNVIYLEILNVVKSW